jgi:hypothetical protein
VAQSILSKHRRESASGKVDTSAERLSTDKENEAQQSEGYLSAYDGGEAFQLPANGEEIGANPDPVKINRRGYMEEQ